MTNDPVDIDQHCATARPVAQDPRRKALIADVLDDLSRLAGGARMRS